MSVSSVNSGDDEQTNMSLELSRFELNWPTSPVHSGASQVVVESPSHYEAPAVPVVILELLDSVVQMSQLSALSYVQLSPDRVHEDCTSESVDVFPVYQVSPDNTGYLPATSPVTPPIPGSLPTSPIPRGPDSLPPGTTGSFDSLLGYDLFFSTKLPISLEICYFHFRMT